MTDIQFIEVSGAPRERGRQYGEAARDRITASLGFYRAALTRSSGLSWPKLIERARLWEPVVAGFAPDLLEEARGIAEGAGVDPADILVLNARGEVAYDARFADLGDDGCSSFALVEGGAGDGHVYCGQNWDWRAGVQETLVVLRVVQPPRPTVITTVEAGQIGRQGANSAGIGLNANGLGGRFGAGVGVPQTFIRRRVLDSAHYRDALAVPFEARQQIATNLLLTHADGVALDLETTPNRHAWLSPENGVLAHTNHYEGPVPPQIADDYRPFSVDSLYRVQMLRRALRRCGDAAETTKVRALIAEGLTDHFGHPYGVCAHVGEQEPDPAQATKTILSSIVDLTSGDVLIAAGNPCEAEYRPLPWNLYDGPAGAATVHGEGNRDA
jgi:isopenicillin-N N-acyltransferase-like protein